MQWGAACSHLSKNRRPQAIWEAESDIITMELAEKLRIRQEKLAEAVRK
jgi:hypothetical protein